MTRVESKNIFKIIGAVLLILACCLSMTTSVAAFNAQEEAKAISSNPENIYTVYIGMPRADVEANWGNVNGWTFKSDKFLTSISREYSKWGSVKAGANLIQQIFVQFDTTNHVYDITANFYTDNIRLANNVYNTMYSMLLSKYGNPYKITENRDLLANVKWLSNGHVYFLHMIHFKGGVKTILLVRPIHDFDY